MKMLIVCCLMFLTACSVDVPYYQIQRAEEFCQTSSGVGVIHTSRLFWIEDIEVVCGDYSTINLTPLRE